MSTRNSCTTSRLKNGPSAEKIDAASRETGTDNPICQIRSVAQMCDADGGKETVWLPWPTQIRLWLRKRMNGPFKRAIKRHLTSLAARRRRNATSCVSTPPSLKAGDLVRVLSREEIQATLNPWGELRGCAFMDGMLPYCGTTQRVFKPVERFMDERNYKVRKTRGVVLLEGVTCEGTESLGKCDRSCLFFWREEWLEKEENQH